MADEKTSEEIELQREQDEIKHRQKHEALDKMIRRNQHKAMRMERINPRTADYPDLTAEEVEEIEKELATEFTDEDIEKVKKNKGFDVKIKKRRKDREERERKHRKKLLEQNLIKTNEGQNINTEGESPAPVN